MESSASGMPTLQQSDFIERIEPLRPVLLRLARQQLRNDVWAEDAVSEAIVAAIQSVGNFSNKSSFKTWVVGILKYKVLDQLRLHARDFQTPEHDEEDMDLDDLIFKPDGHFQHTPIGWSDPGDEIQRRELFEVLEICIDGLPDRLSRVFLMREWLEIESNVICQEIGITSTNLYAMLHRARMRLRECLQLKWFG